MKQLDYSHLLSTTWADQFDEDQLEIIRSGINSDLDVTIYAKPEFASQQMHQIRLGLEEKLDVSVYAKPEISAHDMHREREKQIRDKLASVIDNIGNNTVRSHPNRPTFAELVGIAINDSWKRSTA